MVFRAKLTKKLEDQVAGQMAAQVEELTKVIESIHAYLEIIAREQIRTRLEMRREVVEDEDVDTIIRRYEESLK